MTPATRAAADRFILDTANVRYVAEYLRKEELQCVVETTGMTVGQTIGHIALDMSDLATAIEELIAGGELASHDAGCAARSAAHSRLSARWGSKALLRRLDAGLVALTAALAKLDSTPVGEASAGWPMAHAFNATHVPAHGLELSEALEDLRFDPMMLNWLLYADFSAEPELFDRQRKLFEEARDYFHELGEDAEED